jgi:hypothetical protein
MLCRESKEVVLQGKSSILFAFYGLLDECNQLRSLPSAKRDDLSNDVQSAWEALSKVMLDILQLNPLTVNFDLCVFAAQKDERAVALVPN